MGESAMEFKRQPEAWSRRNLWESNAFGYFGHTGLPFPQSLQTAPITRTSPARVRGTCWAT
jgi:hypothetical protein